MDLVARDNNTRCTFTKDVINCWYLLIFQAGILFNHNIHNNMYDVPNCIIIMTTWYNSHSILYRW
jgi:hypothetical protein